VEPSQPAFGKVPESAAAAAKRKKDQEEVALRIEKLQKEMSRSVSVTAPSAPVAAAAPVAGLAPALPVSGDKAQKLAELLRLYQADQITPLQYHTARAKIVAEP